MNTLITLYRDERGVTAIEYALIGTLVALATIVALMTIGGGLNTIFTDVGTEIINNAAP